MTPDATGIPGAFTAGRRALLPLASRLGKPDRDASPIEQARAAAQQDFASILSESVAARGGGLANKPASTLTEGEKDTQARQAAQDFVAVAFLQPILKQLRNSSIGGDLAPPLGPGPGEKQFRSLADTQVARKLARANHWPLIDTLTKNLRSKASDPLSKDAVANAPALPGSPADINRRAAARAAALLDPSKAGPDTSQKPSTTHSVGDQFGAVNTNPLTQPKP